MARTFSLSLVVVLLLIFAITEASRGQTNQTDGQKIQNRGATRYNSKSTTESSNLSTETRSPRDNSSHSEAVSNLEKHEAHFAREGSIRSRSRLKQTADDSVTTSRTSSKRSNITADNSRNRQKSHATQPLKEEITRNDNKEDGSDSRTLKRLPASRRTSSDASAVVWVDNAKLDHEVSTKTPDLLRSRTGRKIYANHRRELRGEVISRKPPEDENVEKAEGSSSESKREEARSGYSRAANVASKVSVSREIDTKGMNSSSERKDEAKDVLLSGSESVRVDVPLTDEDTNLLTSATVPSVDVSPRQAPRPVQEKVESNDIARSSVKRGRQSDRSKSRDRSKTRDPNLEKTEKNSDIFRRNSFKSDGTAETNGRASGSKRRSKNDSRGRSAHKSRDAIAAETGSGGRQRNADTDTETNTNGRTEARRNDKRTSEGKRRSKDGGSKAAEAKVDEQDIRAQSRSRSRSVISNLEVTTTYISKTTIAETTTAPSVDTEITMSDSTTIGPSTTARTSSSTERASRNKGRESSRAKKPPKEDFFNHGLGFRGRKSSTEGSMIVASPRTTTTSKNEMQSRGNPGWTLRRRPSHVNYDAPSSTTSTSVNRDQINEIILSNSSSTETPLDNVIAGQRGTKKPKIKDENNIVSDIAAKNITRGNKTFNKSESLGLPKGAESESDNYPPAFRARLSELKNSNSKSAGGKSTSRTSLQATKPSLASLFSERSKMKLELARRLIKPELNVDDFDVTTAAYSDKSKAREISREVGESRNVGETTEATFGGRVAARAGGPTTVASTPKERAKGRWKILGIRKSLKDREVEAALRPPATKRDRATSEGAVTLAPSVEEASTRSVVEFNAIPSPIPGPDAAQHRDGVSAEDTAAVGTTKVRSATSRTSPGEASTLTNAAEAIEENSVVTIVGPPRPDKTLVGTVTLITDATAQPKARPTEFPQEVTLPPTVTTPSSMLPPSTESGNLYPVYIPGAKERNSLVDEGRTAVPGEVTSSNVRSRYARPQQRPSSAGKVAISMVTSRTVGPTSRYIRKKSGVFTPYDAAPRASSTEATPAQTKRREFRPRTSTYRRHSEVLTGQQVAAGQRQSATAEWTTIRVADTPKPTRYHAQIVTPSARTSPPEPLRARIDDDASNGTRASGVAGGSGSGGSNIFNPTRSTYLSANTTTLLEQLRSTVAPLLSNLGDRTPIFSGTYSNVNTNSAPRITPNGSPPKFSARYKGAELFVRKPSINQVVVPSITTSSTTTSTPIENSGSAPPVDVNSPGEPRFVTFYQALESASIRNENLGAEDVSQQRLTGVVTKVDPNATVSNGAANNNDTIASIIAITTSSPDTTTIDITTTVRSPADNSLASRLGAENSTDDNSETTMTVQTLANPNGREVTPVPISESPETTVSINMITNTSSFDANVPGTAGPLTTTETSTNVADVTLSSTEIVPEDGRSTEPIDTSTETTEVARLLFTEMINTSVSMLAPQNLQTTSDATVLSPINENITVTRISPDTTITVQQPEETTVTTSTAEPTTTEEISNDIIETRMTTTPAFTSTYRTRLIDYAQDILSRLHKGFSTVRTPVQESIFTTIVSPELFNTIPDSSSTNTENPEETTIVRRTGLGNMGTTVDVDVELMSTNGPEVTIDTTYQGQSNGQETLDSSTIEQTISSIVDNERNATSDPESTMIAQTPPTNEEVATLTPTTTSRLVDSFMENNPSNDTLLAELMTIAKTLFTEAMNDTRQSLQTDGTVGNDDKNRSVSSNDTEATTAPSKLSKPLESTIERVDVKTPVYLPGNEREDNSTRGPVVESITSLMETDARPTDVDELGDVTTMSLSQIKTEILNTIMGSMNSELTTNTPDSQLSNPIESSNNNTGQQTVTTVAANKVLSNRLSEFAMNLITNSPLTSTANTERTLLDVNESTTSDVETVMELTTSVAMTEINVVQTTAIDTTANQTSEPITIIPVSDLQVTNRSLVNASDIVTILPTVSNTQPFGTEPPVTESVRNLNSTYTTTNRFNDTTTTNVPQTLIDLVSEMPNLITPLQDTTTVTTTAQATAGSRLIQLEQTTEITTTIIVPNDTASSTDSTTFPVSSINATTIPSSIESTTTTTTMTTTSTIFRTSTETSSQSELTTTVKSEPTTMTLDINENLVSNETTTDTSTTRDTTVTPTESENVSGINNGEAMMTTTTRAAPSITNTSTTVQTTVLNRVSSSSAFTPLNTRPYLGRFGGSQMTPDPRFSFSKAPVRDYLIYGVYPNKTIVRKRPEDNLIDGRNVNSPYVIFGIYPDGRLVRKFPNGTIIPDSPRNPVEVVFTLTTTTNRPAPRPYYYNQANQAGAYNNQYQAPVYDNNGRLVDKLTGGAQNLGPLDFGLIGNAIGVTPGGPNFAGSLGPSASVPSTNKMSNILLNTKMGAIPNATFGNLQTPNNGQVQGPIGPSIFQDRERNEASRTRVTSDQRSAVYIGQDKFINYQIDGAPDINPKVVDVRINSVATSVNEGTASSTASIPSFENLLNNQSGGGVITAPPGFPWRDPLDQIFGITTNSPIQTASVASNRLDEPTESNTLMSRPINPLVEVFTPVVNSATPTSTATTAGTTPTTTVRTGTASTITSGTIPSSRTTSRTTTVTPAPTTAATTTTTSTTTTTKTTTTSTTTPATSSQTTTASRGTVPSSSTTSALSADNILSRLQANTMENPFGTTFGDLAFLNSLLQNNNVESTTPKTLSEVEQILANRILSLALANPGPTRSPKAIQTVSLNTNAIKTHPSSGSSSGPIIIDLLPISSSSVISSTSPTKKYTETISTKQPASAAPIITTRAPIVITAKPKTTARPRTTTPRGATGFGRGIWRALFGNFFDATTAASAARSTKPKNTKATIKATTQRSAGTAQTPVVKSTRSVDISDIHVASSTSLADSIVSASTPSMTSATLLNNPRPKLNDDSTSTYSPEDDAKFLAALLQAVQTRTVTSTSASTRGLSDDDEAFLRAILSNQASVSTTTSSSTEVNPAALLALLLKQQGIEPTTPATKLREQLQLSNVRLLTPDATSTTRPTTNRPVSTARQVVTSKPSARPRPKLQTTTWSPSSTYPPPLFGGSESSGSGLITATRAIGRFLGAAISGAAQQLQSLLRNNTRNAAD